MTDPASFTQGFLTFFCIMVALAICAKNNDIDGE